MKRVEYSKKVEGDILSKDWEFGYERRMTYQRIRGFNYSHHYQFPKLFGITWRYEVFRINEGNVSLYREPTESIKALSVIEDKLLNPKSKKFITNLSKIVIDYNKEFAVFTKKLPTSYDLFSDQRILKKYKEIYRMDNKISLTNRLTFTQFEEVLTNVIKKMLSTKKDDTESILKALSCPSILTPLDIYKKELSTILLSPIPKQEKLLNRFSKKYVHWGMFDFNYEEADRNYHENKLKELDIKEAEYFEAEIKGKYRNQNKKIKEILHKYLNNKHLCSLLKLYLTSASIKEWKNYYREQNSYKLKFLMEEISRRFGLTLPELSFMTFEEISSLIKRKLEVNKHEFGRRMKNSAFVFIANSLAIVTNENELKKLDKILDTSAEAKIEGKIVFQGIVRGIAKIVVSDKDFHKVNKGDILIAGTTRPSYVPIMQKASAFVTNEGGLLSHAAIIAREMKKPCIVGTKIATKVLKDGDMVEVDAEKGVVKILKKA